MASRFPFFKFLYEKENKDIPLKVKVFNAPELITRDEFRKFTANDIFVILRDYHLYKKMGKLIPEEKIDELSMHSCYTLLMTAEDINKFIFLCKIFGKGRLNSFRLPDILDIIKRQDISTVFEMFGYEKMSMMTKEMKYDLITDDFSGERNYKFFVENGLIDKNSSYWGLWG